LEAAFAGAAAAAGEKLAQAQRVFDQFAGQAPRGGAGGGEHGGVLGKLRVHGRAGEALA